MSIDVMDPTDLKARLHNAEEALRKSSALVTAGLHAGAIMHEVNNPLEAIGNLLYLAQLTAGDPEQMLAYIQQADIQMRRVQQIANKSLSFYRQNSQAQLLAVHELLEAALQVHRAKLFESKLQLLKDCSEACYVRGCAGQLLQVFSNLILNAIEALRPDGTLAIRLRQREDGVRVTIADNGPGLPELAQQSLFQPLQGTTKATGTGFGLWVAHGIILNHGGTIRCRTSRRDSCSGTLFSIRFSA